MLPGELQRERERERERERNRLAFTIALNVNYIDNTNVIEIKLLDSRDIKNYVQKIQCRGHQD